MRSCSFIKLIEQSIKTFKLDLSGYNILLPASVKEPALAPLMASMAGAKNVYVVARGNEVINKTSFVRKNLD